jgi:hypothetical protein
MTRRMKFPLSIAEFNFNSVHNEQCRGCGTMTWSYAQKTGALRHNGTPVATGYSGNTTGLNNPDEQDRIGVGPPPRGDYTVGPPHRPIDHLGPLALPLFPATTNEMHGRCGFFIHGDNARMNHTASNGCIILDRASRQAIVNSRDNKLVIVAGD